MKRQTVYHRIVSPGIPQKLLLAVAADIHSRPFEDLLDTFRRTDAVLLPGDLVDRHRRDNHLAAEFLRRVPEEVPVFYAIGNHERKFPDQEAFRSMLRNSRARVLDNEECLFRGIRLGGLSSTLSGQADTAFLDRFEAGDGF